MTNYKLLCAIAAGFLATAVTSSAEILTQYILTSGGYRLGPESASFQAEHITAGGLTPYLNGAPSTDSAARGMGFTGINGYIGVQSYVVGNAANPGNNFFQFDLTVEDGYQANFSAISFDYYAPQIVGNSGNGTPGTGNVFWDVRSSADNYATTLYTVGTNISRAWLSVTDEALAPLSGITGSITFRIYMYQETAGDVTGNQGFLRNISIKGETMAIPEPGTYAAVLALASVIVLGRRSLKRRK